MFLWRALKPGQLLRALDHLAGPREGEAARYESPAKVSKDRAPQGTLRNISVLDGGLSAPGATSRALEPER